MVAAALVADDIKLANIVFQLDVKMEDEWA